jgi:hypothetical protein
VVDATLRARLADGRRRYGTLTPAKKTREEWILEAYEECVDALVYLQMAIYAEDGHD